VVASLKKIADQVGLRITDYVDVVTERVVRSYWRVAGVDPQPRGFPL